MANLPETQTYDAGVYQLETTDPVVGGPTGVSNTPLKNLANRTAYLKKHIDDIESGAVVPAGLATIASPAFTGNPTVPNQAAGDNDTSIANTAFVKLATGGVLTKSVAGGAQVTLTADETGNAIIVLTGALTASINVIVPTAADQWLVRNATSGAFTVTVKTAAGTGVAVTQGTTSRVFCDGTNVLVGVPFEATASQIKMNGTQGVGSAMTVARGDHVHPSDTSRAPLASPALTGTPTAPTAAVGTSTTQIATTAFVSAEIGNDRPFEATAANIKMNGTQAVGTANTVARGDHVHPSDTSRAPLASPAFTGTPTAPTPAQFDNDTSIATTAFVKQQGMQASTFQQNPAVGDIPASYAGSYVWLDLNARPNAKLPDGGVPVGSTFIISAGNGSGSAQIYPPTGGYFAFGAVPEANNAPITLQANESLLLVCVGPAAYEVVAGGLSASPAFLRSLAANGYQKLPSGLIIQWGTAAGTGVFSVTFPIAFPNSCFSVVASCADSLATAELINVSSIGLTGFTATGNNASTTGIAVDGRYIAIGY